ncbi:MAG: hypothetical protein IBX55_14910 [Methyloprofundus sp.]|nr:hypothetical protein [Methyloprofundus sp.]MBW6452286.1 hypothetical protein [Methyloprofundus sp.]
MINILWVEDEFSEQKKTEWFNHRNVCVKTNFLAAKEAINHSLAQFDVAVLDINLENTEHSAEIKRLAEHFKITEQAFLEESGMNLFLSLLEKGFPKEQIVFLTANADNNISLVEELRKAFTAEDYDRFDSILAEIQRGLGEEQLSQCEKLINTEKLAELFEYLENYYKDLIQDETKNTYNRFCEAYKRCRIEPPEAINKNLKEAKHSLNSWLGKHEKNAYLVLRRGIIEGCAFLKSHIEEDDDRIQLRDFIKKENGQPTIEIVTTDIENYLDTLSQFLPLKQPNEQAALNIQYRLFLRTLVHEWEENILAPKSNTFARISKSTRNWTSHANLLDPLNTEIIAFLFLVNTRAMFKLPKAIQPYEEILLNCISSSLADNLQNLDSDIKYAEECVDGILFNLKIPEYKEDKSGNKICDKSGNEILKDFGDKINAIYRRNTGNHGAESHDFKQFLLQYFWINQKSNSRNLTVSSNDFLPTLARHIYKSSFPEV